MTKRICVWSGPRNISTALMYSFAQRVDTTVVDEPLYAHYLTHTDAREYHPGAEEVIADQENDGQKVIEEVVFGEYDTPVVFFKHMTHHLVDLDWSFMKDTINVILTRDPKDMLRSIVHQIPNPVMRDVGYAQHLELMEYLNGIGQSPIVIDSKEVLMEPEKKLTEICEFLGLSFDKRMLNWKPGARPEDGIWAKYWYHNVHKSTGFQPYKPKTDPFPNKLKELLTECEECYEKLIK
ncbi:MAG: sulfotransferase family protein [Balneolaceae bacterium]